MILSLRQRLLGWKFLTILFDHYVLLTFGGNPKL